MAILSVSKLYPVKSEYIARRGAGELFPGLAWFCLLLGWLFFVGANNEADGAQKALGEYEIKSGFLYNFIKYIEWPPQVFPSPQSAIVLGILGADSYGIGQALRGQTLNGRPLQVSVITGNDEIKK